MVNSFLSSSKEKVELIAADMKFTPCKRDCKVVVKMISSDWLAKTFEIVKFSPNFTSIFEKIENEIQYLFHDNNFDEIIGSSKDSVSSYCGVSFKKDQLLYHCR